MTSVDANFFRVLDKFTRTWTKKWKFFTRFQLFQFWLNCRGFFPLLLSRTFRAMTFSRTNFIKIFKWLLPFLSMLFNYSESCLIFVFPNNETSFVTTTTKLLLFAKVMIDLTWVNVASIKSTKGNIDEHKASFHFLDSLQKLHQKLSSLVRTLNVMQVIQIVHRSDLITEWCILIPSIYRRFVYYCHGRYFSLCNNIVQRQYNGLWLTNYKNRDTLN